MGSLVASRWVRVASRQLLLSIFLTNLEGSLAFWYAPPWTLFTGLMLLLLLPLFRSGFGKSSRGLAGWTLLLPREQEHSNLEANPRPVPKTPPPQQLLRFLFPGHKRGVMGFVRLLPSLASSKSPFRTSLYAWRASIGVLTRRVYNSGTCCFVLQLIVAGHCPGLPVANHPTASQMPYRIPAYVEHSKDTGDQLGSRVAGCNSCSKMRQLWEEEKNTGSTTTQLVPKRGTELLWNRLRDWLGYTDRSRLSFLFI